MKGLISIEGIFYFLIFVCIFFLIYFLLQISYCYSDKETLKISDLSKEELNSKEMIRFLILPHYEEKTSVYYKTKLKYFGITKSLLCQ